MALLENTKLALINVQWYPKRKQKSCLNMVKNRSIVCDYTRTAKINFEGFTQNGCYGSQIQPFEVVFYSIDTNTSCSFTKQNLTVVGVYVLLFAMNLRFDSYFLFSVLLTGFIWTEPYFTPYSVDKSSHVT